jgi:hypothetical protein
VKETKYDGRDLRRVLAGMVTDRTVCARIAARWEPPGLFDSKHANLIGQWCVRHLEQYGRPPNGELEAIFENWASKPNTDEAVVRRVERFLSDMSDEHASQGDPPSADYVLDCADRLFNTARLRQKIERAEEHLSRGETRQAHEVVTGSSLVELGTGSLVRPAEDYDAWRTAFDVEDQRPLLGYPDRLDGFLGRSMVRDSLIAFMGPDKSGKSFWLLDLAYRAVRERHRVAFFEAGDMGRRAVMLRLGTRAARRSRFGGRVKIPLDVTWEGEVRTRTDKHDEPLPAAEAFKAFQKACRGRDLFRLSCHPNSSISVAGIVSILRDWEREGWVPDVVAVDYADILAAPSGFRETNDQIDQTWKELRRLSQDLHCLVATATQSSALAYRGGGTLGRRHFSGRKTKLAHVNGMVGINVTDEDKRKGVTRLNWVVKRDGAFREGVSVPVAGCLAIANPAIRSVKDRGRV